MMEVVVTTGAIRRAKLQSNDNQQTRPDALPVAQPTALSNLGIYFSLFQVNTKHLMMISN